MQGSTINLDGILVEFDGWKGSKEAWTIVDQDQSPTGFAIFGGNNDPDGWVIFEFIRSGG